MSQTLSPPVGVRHALQRFGPLPLFAVGGLIGGLALGLGLGAATVASESLTGAAVGVGWALAIVSLAGLASQRLWKWFPQRACQVAAGQRFRQGRSTTSLIWGIQLGAGVTTYLVTPAFYGLLGVAFALQSPLTAVLAGAVYGLTRCLMIDAVAVVRRQARLMGQDILPLVGLEARMRLPLAATIVIGLALSL